MSLFPISQHLLLAAGPPVPFGTLLLDPYVVDSSSSVFKSGRCDNPSALQSCLGSSLKSGLLGTVPNAVTE